MKTVAKPLNVTPINLLDLTRGWFARPVKVEKTMNSIAGLAGQRCAGYTKRSATQKARDY